MNKITLVSALSCLASFSLHATQTYVVPKPPLLMQAVHASDIKFVQFLLAKQHNATEQDSNGNTPLMVAIQKYCALEQSWLHPFCPPKLLTERSNLLLIIQTLIDHTKAHLETKNMRGQTALACAVYHALYHQSNDCLPIQELLAAGAQINTKDALSASPLINAAVFGNKFWVYKLIVFGADALLKDFCGFTARDCAQIFEKMTAHAYDRAVKQGLAEREKINMAKRYKQKESCIPGLYTEHDEKNNQ